jgi:hypothetical protein
MTTTRIAIFSDPNRSFDWRSVMELKLLMCALMVATLTFFAGSALAGDTSAQPTLWGIYGSHSLHDCPVNNRETAKEVVAISKMDLAPLMAKYGVTAIVDQYHSGLEHTFLWIVKTNEPHKLEEFSIELGVARWNDLKFVPARTFADVIADIRSLHGLKD